MHDDLLEHYHGHEGEGLQLTPNPDKLKLISVGIDIGSATSHVVFSALHLERRGTQLTSRYEVVERQPLYRSPVLLTPYRDASTIDMEPLGAFIDASYREAGLERSEINTGAVICTGEAVKKNNAEAITRLVSDEGGKFVCAMAGPHLEGVLAAHGSGAVARSIELPGVTLLNVDVGGGTAKVTVIRDGEVLETGAISAGARLVAWDADGRLERIEGPALLVARHLDIDLSLGVALRDEDRTPLAEALADALLAYMGRAPMTELASGLIVTEPLRYDGPVDRILFSGGVSEYIYGREVTEYDDLGPLLGSAVRKRIEASGIPVEESVEYIRATVLGASEYTVQVSSSTIFLSRRDALPVRDRQVVVPRFVGTPQTPDSVAQAIELSLARTDLADAPNRPIALYVDWREPLSHASFHTLATGIAQVLTRREDDPWVLLFAQDIAGLVGSLLKHDLGVSAEVIAADEVIVKELDFVDIGQAIVDEQAVPVVVKSLVFG